MKTLLVATFLGAALQQAEASAAAEDAPIVRAVQSVLSKSGRLVADPRTDSLVVTDIPEAFPQVEQVIAELDKPVRKATEK